MKPLSRSLRANQTGLTMIEILVVIIIMAVGLLGIAALQVTGVRATNNSNLQTHAMTVTKDLMDRIRTNREGVIDVAGNLDLSAYGKAAGTDFPGAAVASCATVAGCTAAELATTDLFQWGVQLKGTLPIDDAGLKNNVVVCLDSTPATIACDGLGSAIKIALSWTESTALDQQTGNTTQNYVISFEP